MADSHSEMFMFLGLLLVLLAAAVQQMLPSPPATCVGIDLGTTFSCVAVFEDGDVTVINNRAGRSITPSVLFVPDDGADLVIGEGARDAAAAHAGTLLYDAKRFIGKRYVEEAARREARGLPFELVPGASAVRRQLEPHLQVAVSNGTLPVRFAPEDVGTLIVHELKKAAEVYVGREVQNAVLAVPVGFNARQINATREAAAAAGFNVLRTIHEPTAAAMAYGLHTRSQVHTVMVYDIGGGTLDVSLLNLNNGIFEVMAAAGDNRLGGQDFNLVLLEHLTALAADALPPAHPLGGRAAGGARAIEADAEVMRGLREEAERIKIELNDEADCGGNFEKGDVPSVTVELPAAVRAAGELVVTRAAFEGLMTEAGLFERALAPVSAALAKIGMAPAEVDELVLVGGSSRMAAIRQLLQKFFDGREPNCDVSPEEAVAHGTAIQAAILTDRKKISVGATEAALHAHLDVER